MNNEPIKKTTDSLWMFVVFILVILLLWVASWILIAKYLPDWQTRSSFGQMFGVTNTLFSGAALAGVIFALLLQRRELEMTRQALSQSTKAQEKSEKALNEQAKLMLLTARMNAMSSRLDAHKTQMELHQREGFKAGGKIAQDDFSDFKKYLEELTKIVDEVNDTYGAT